MKSKNNATAINQICENIERFGWHIYVVIGDPCPRWAYTVGCLERIGAEFVFAGGAFYSADQVRAIINHIATVTTSVGNCDGLSQYDIADLGTFRLRLVANSWVALLLLGALDYYSRTELPVWQIVPDDIHHTNDTPLLCVPFNPAIALPWQWLTMSWPFTAPATSTATTNLAALRGGTVTELMRWEEDDWEMFAGAGPDVPRHELRVVPLGTMIAVDPSLSIVANIEIGKGLWRDIDEMQWNVWG